MFLVETLAGVFMVFGVMMRAMSVILFGAFLFLSYSLGENPIGHIIFYGILFTFITNGSGRWRRPEATDTPGDIVILGGGFAAVHCAMRLERLLGQYSNVRVTLVHDRNSFLFSPLLPEVIGGSIQPGSIINPLRRICPATRVLHHAVARIDCSAREVHMSSSDGPVTIPYDRLIVALDREPEFGGVPGLVDHGLPMVTIGDSLYLRQRVLENLELAEEHEDDAARAALLTYCVIGAGVLGCAVAAEIRNLLRAALPSFPAIKPEQTRVALVESGARILGRYSEDISDAATRRLRKLGVDVITGATARAVTPNEVICSDGGVQIACRTVVGTQSVKARLWRQLSGSSAEQATAYMELPTDPNIFAVGHGASDLPFMVLREIRAGRRAGYNALASLQGMRQKPWQPDQPSAFTVSLGMHASVARLWGLHVGGRVAWTLHRLSCLFALPGLERNLRILVDWLLDMVFRDDIAVLAPQQTVKLSGAHFEPGDVIIREGEAGESAYVILAGKVEVTREQGQETIHLTTLSEGECFGEIALLTDAKRTATVTCLTPVDVTVLHREQFLALSEGFHDLGEAMRVKMRRHAASDESLGLG
jgi:NADH dehydrogenase FAD-containing subunit